MKSVTFAAGSTSFHFFCFSELGNIAEIVGRKTSNDLGCHCSYKKSIFIFVF